MRSLPDDHGSELLLDAQLSYGVIGSQVPGSQVSSAGAAGQVLWVWEHT